MSIAQVLPLRLPLPSMAPSATVLGKGELDIRRRILAACIGRRQNVSYPGGTLWESEPTLVPLVSENSERRMVCAEVALVFIVDTDPEAIVAAMTGSFVDASTFQGAPTSLSSIAATPLADGSTEPAPSEIPPCGGPAPFKSPDLVPDGWVCRDGPGGRKFWHHLALGPPPWERPLEELAGQREDVTGQAALVRSMMGKVASLRGARPARQQRSRN